MNTLFILLTAKFPQMPQIKPAIGLFNDQRLLIVQKIKKSKFGKADQDVL